MKLFTVPEMTCKGHWQCHTLLDCLEFLSESVKVAYTYFQTKLLK